MACRLTTVAVLAGSVLSALVPVSAHAEKDAIAGATATSVPLANVIALAAPYPNLRQQIRLARIAASGGATPTCSARKLGVEWVQLKGRTIGPYRCQIGKRMLDITTRLTVFDRAKHKMESNAPDAPRRAATLNESRLVWRWY